MGEKKRIDFMVRFGVVGTGAGQSDKRVRWRKRVGRKIDKIVDGHLEVCGNLAQWKPRAKYAKAMAA